MRSAIRAACGSAMILPPEVVAPTTIAADIKTTFLMMYCPSSVGAYGKCFQVSEGKKSNGRNVPGSCRKSKRRVLRRNLPERRPTPITHSHEARTYTQT